MVLHIWIKRITRDGSSIADSVASSIILLSVMASIRLSYLVHVVVHLLPTHMDMVCYPKKNLGRWGLIYVPSLDSRAVSGQVYSGENIHHNTTIHLCLLEYLDTVVLSQYDTHLEPI